MGEPPSRRGQTLFVTRWYATRPGLRRTSRGRSSPTRGAGLSVLGGAPCRRSSSGTASSPSGFPAQSCRRSRWPSAWTAARHDGNCNETNRNRQECFLDRSAFSSCV
eukprot:3369673-Pyramimonas_sp.AAC.2